MYFYLAILEYIILKSKGLNVYGVIIHDVNDLPEAAGLSEKEQLRESLFDKTNITSVGTDEMHASCLVKLNDNSYVFADSTWRYVSEPFYLEDSYYSFPNNRYELKVPNKKKGLLKDIEIRDQKGLRSWFILNFALVYKYWAKTGESLKYFDQAIETDSDNFGAFYSAADTYLELGNYDMAIQYAQRAIDVNPYDKMLYYVYDIWGKALVSTGRNQEAIPLFEKAVQLKADPFAYVYLGIIYKSLRLYDKAIENYKKDIQIEPQSPVPYDGLGCIYLELNDTNQTRSYFEKAIDLYKKINNSQRAKELEDELNVIR